MLFKHYGWERFEAKEALLNRYEQLKKFGMSMEIIYKISRGNPEELISDIIREAEIRLFDCEILTKILQ